LLSSKKNFVQTFAVLISRLKFGPCTVSRPITSSDKSPEGYIVVLLRREEFPQDLLTTLKMPSLWRRLRSKTKKSKANSSQDGFGRLVDDATNSRDTIAQAPARRRNSAGEVEGQQEHARRAVRFASRDNLHAAQTLHTNDSPALSRASSLSSTDLDYLNAQAFRTESSKPRKTVSPPHLPVRPPQNQSQTLSSEPQVDWEAFSGAFAPQPRVHMTRYPVPPLTPQQLNELAGAYAPPAPTPKAVTFR